MQPVLNAVEHDDADIIEVEAAEFGGVDHAEVGSILARHWHLPEPIAASIRWHHRPESGLPDNLVALVHVAEVMSNALDLPPRQSNHVTYLSDDACRQLKIDWSEDMSAIYGEMEARSAYACEVFR